MKFGEGRERQNIHEIKADDLEKWIDSHEDWSESTKRTYSCCLSPVGGGHRQGLVYAQHRDPLGAR